MLSTTRERVQLLVLACGACGVLGCPTLAVGPGESSTDSTGTAATTASGTSSPPTSTSASESSTSGSATAQSSGPSGSGADSGSTTGPSDLPRCWTLFSEHGSNSNPFPPVRYVWSVRDLGGSTYFFGGWDGSGGNAGVASVAVFDAVGGLVTQQEMPEHARLADGLLLADGSLLVLAFDFGGTYPDQYTLERFDTAGTLQWSVALPMVSTSFGPVLAALPDDTILVVGRGDYLHSDHAWIGQYSIVDGGLVEEATLGERGSLGPLVSVGGGSVRAVGYRLVYVSAIAGDVQQGWIASIETQPSLSIEVTHLAPQPRRRGDSTICGAIVGDETGVYAACTGTGVARYDLNGDEVWHLGEDVSGGTLTLAEDGGVQLGLNGGYDRDGNHRCQGSELVDCSYFDNFGGNGVYDIGRRSYAFYPHFRDQGSDLDGPICVQRASF